MEFSYLKKNNEAVRKISTKQEVEEAREESVVDTHPETIERLRILSAQLHAVIMVSAQDQFSMWHPDIREPYMWLVTDMSQEVRDGLQKIVSDSCTSQQQKRRRA